MESTTGGINSLTVSKYYTGEPVTFTTDEIGVPTIGSGTPLENSDYEITYANNTNAGTAKMFLIGKSSYENSIKEYNFTINKTPVTEVTANDYVEKIADAKPEDYKTALGMVIKAKVPGTNKVLTLTEGTDYTVAYSISGTTLTATATLKSTSNFTNPTNTAILTKTATITKATLNRKTSS